MSVLPFYASLVPLLIAYVTFGSVHITHLSWDMMSMRCHVVLMDLLTLVLRASCYLLNLPLLTLAICYGHGGTLKCNTTGF